MKVNFIGKINQDSKSLIARKKITLVEDIMQADFVVFSAKVGAYSLTSSLGETLERAYELEFQLGKPEVITENELLNKAQQENKGFLRV